MSITNSRIIEDSLDRKTYPFVCKGSSSIQKQKKLRFLKSTTFAKAILTHHNLHSSNTKSEKLRTIETLSSENINFDTIGDSSQIIIGSLINIFGEENPFFKAKNQFISRNQSNNAKSDQNQDEQSDQDEQIQDEKITFKMVKRGERQRQHAQPINI